MKDRREFLTMGAATMLASPAILGKAGGKQWKACVIGHTGRGNFGHGLDVVWNLLEETYVEAVADADPNGLKNAKKRLKTEKGYLDYREMLVESKPDIVAVCPRHVDQRVPMVTAACEAGAKGIYVEKPFARSLKEADKIAAACKESGVKLAVAHRNRYHPVIPTLLDLLKQGLIGDVLEMRGRGKEDRRGGGEDLWVLGTHIFDLFHSLAGKPLSCSAEVRQNGKTAAKADVYEGNEGLGPLTGDEIHARWRMENGWNATFDSIRNLGRREASFGLQIIGNRGVIDLRNDKEPLAHFMEGSPFQPTKSERKWIPVSSAGVGKPEPNDIRGTVHNHIAAARDLISSIRENRDPECGIIEAVSTVEFVSSVFESHRMGGKNVSIPLTTRENPLTLLGREN